MHLRDKFRYVISLFLLWASVGGSAPICWGRGAGDFHFSDAQFWCNEWATGPRLPMVGDADGDGFADLISLWPEGDGVIDLTQTSPLGKQRENVQARRNFGKDGVAAACGRSTPSQTGTDTLGVFRDGAIYLASGMMPGKNQYPQSQRVGRIAGGKTPRSPIKARTGDFDGDGAPDVLLIGSDGSLLLLLNRLTATKNVPDSGFVAVTVEGRLPINVREVAVGANPLDKNDGRARIFWVDATKTLCRSVLSPLPNPPAAKGEAGKGFRLAAPFPVLTGVGKAKLAVGRFRGEGMDVLIGQKLLPDGDPKRALFLPNLPTEKEAEEDEYWLVGDFDNNGRDDLLRKRDAHERFVEKDVYIHYAYRDSDDRKGFISAAQDGLLDDWKTGKVKPGGLDLAAIGCKVGRRDVIVEIGSFDNVDQNGLHGEMAKAVEVYAALPVKNPDGSYGVALHVLYAPPTPAAERDKTLNDFDARYPPREHLGITHYFWAERDGPLVAQIMGGNGHFNGEWVHFLHEFGHNFGLTHEGFWNGPPFCPIYPSLMNYTYNGSLFPVEKVRYSDGRLQNFPVEENHLSERLPLPIEDVEYLSKSPYYFRLKPGAKPNETYVDWNWNGVFGEENIAADINYRPGTHVGYLTPIGKTSEAPALASLTINGEERLLAFFVGGDGAKSGSRPLRLRWWLGKDTEADREKWSDVVTVEEGGVLGEASAVSLSDVCWVSYPTTAGVTIRAVTFADGKAIIGPPTVFNSPVKISPTLIVFQKRLTLLLWREARTPVGLLSLTPNGSLCKASAETRLTCYSSGPVGATEGTTEGNRPCLWVSAVEDRDASHKTWLAFHRFAPDVRGDFVWEESQWGGGRDGGKYAPRRSVLLWEPLNGMEPYGRLYALAGGLGDASQHYIAMNVADKTADADWSLGGGWLTRQYHGAIIRSRAAPGACLFRGEIAFAQRLQDGDPNKNDDLLLMFHGKGIEYGKMGDFNDIEFLTRIGLRRSIFHIAQ